MASKFVCPYCFTSVEFGHVQFRCAGRRICPGGGPDEPLSRYKGLPFPEIGPEYFAGTSRGWKMPEEGSCPQCLTVSRIRVCPACHNQLPANIDTDDQIIISLIGTRGSGKSNYVGVLINELRKRTMLSFGNSVFRLMTDEDQKVYNDNFGDYLYPRTGGPARLIEQTRTNLTGGSSFAQRRPILGTLLIEQKKLFKTIRKAITLVFFDSAGEDFESEETLEVVSRYIAQSQGIIFLVDPLTQRSIVSQIDETKAQLSGEASYSDVSDPTDVINRVIDIIRRTKNLSDAKQIDTPTAVAFSKLDVLKDILPPGAILSRPSPHTRSGSFIEADTQAVDLEIRGLLQAWDSADLVATAGANFKNLNFFAFSALGRAPKSDGTIDPPMPERIEDAFLWILSTQDAIPTQKAGK